MGFMVLDPLRQNNDRGHQIDVTPEKGQEYQAVRIFGKDNSSPKCSWTFQDMLSACFVIRHAQVDLERKLALFKDYYNHSRTHASLDGNTPAEICCDRVAQPALLNSYAWEKHCGGLFQLPAIA